MGYAVQPRMLLTEEAMQMAKLDKIKEALEKMREVQGNYSKAMDAESKSQASIEAKRRALKGESEQYGHQFDFLQTQAELLQ